MNTNEASDVKYAGFWRRFVGWLIDLLILIVITHWVLVFVSSFLSTPIPDTLSFSAPWPKILALIGVDFIIIALYYTLLEASLIQATVGKYIAGLKITDTGGSRISYGKAFARRVYSLISTIPIFTGYLVTSFTPRKQTFHDMIAKTVVVIDKPRKGLVLVGIVILTIVVGMLSEKFLGAGFNVSVVTPSATYSNAGYAPQK